MKILIDDANIEKIKKIYQYYPVDGVTTNPSILANNRKNPYETLIEIRNLIGENAELHVQVVYKKAEDMVKEGRKIQKVLGKATYIKIPVTTEGLKAIKELAEDNTPITATAIYTPMQAFLAGKSGAWYAAPYVNRIDNLGANGIETTKTIHEIFKKNDLKTEVLAASFKNAQQILELCKFGIGAATIGTDVMNVLIKNAAVTSAIDAFTMDFEKLCGSGKTMLNC